MDIYILYRYTLYDVYTLGKYHGIAKILLDEAMGLTIRMLDQDGPDSVGPWSILAFFSCPSPSLQRVALDIEAEAFCTFTSWPQRISRVLYWRHEPFFSCCRSQKIYERHVGLSPSGWKRPCYRRTTLPASGP